MEASSALAAARSIDSWPASCERRRSRASALRRGPINSTSRAEGRLISPVGEVCAFTSPISTRPSVSGRATLAVPDGPATGSLADTGVWAPTGKAAKAASAPTAQPLARRRNEPRLKRPGSRGQVDRQEHAAPLARADQAVTDRLLDFRWRQRLLKDGFACRIALDQAQCPP